MARPTTALIVDDESHVRAFIRLMLREVGITQFWEAPDGVKAISMAQEHQPDIILLDVNMPQMSGIEVLAQFEELGITIPVIMVTSQSAISTVSEAMRLGAVGYVLKHVPKDQAIAALRDVMDDLENADEEEMSEQT